MTEAEREALVQRFREHLEAVDAPASRASTRTAPVGGGVSDDALVDAPATDLFELHTELAALRNEVRLESRQLKGALDTFSEVFDTLRATNARLSGELDERRAAERASERRAAAGHERPLLLETLELRDRLAAGLASARAWRPRGLARVVGGDAVRVVERLADGMAISLRRVDALLASHDVHPIPVLERPLDPHVMRAAAVEHRAGRADGIVVGELRRGYRRGDAVLRLAEVAVNRAPTSTAADDHVTGQLSHE